MPTIWTIRGTITAHFYLGKHCCLWCHIPSCDVKTPLGSYPLRTLAGIKQDHTHFVQAGGDIRKAKHFNNVIQQPIFDVEIDQVGNNM